MGQVKVKEINLERGHPTVDAAIRRLINELQTAKGAGYKALIVVHGYGSSGVGGAIKPAVHSKLRAGSLIGIVRDFVSGEDWMNRKSVFVDVCPQLRDFSNYIAGNRGLTVVLLK